MAQQEEEISLKSPSVEPVFILAGQSNMAGRCDAASLPQQYLNENNDGTNCLNIHGGVDFKMCWCNDSNFGKSGNSNGEWLDLQMQPSPGLEMTCFGPEIALAAALGPRLYQSGIRRAYFIKFAMGSTNLHSNWNPSNQQTSGKPSEIGHYHQFIDFCRSALQNLEVNPRNKLMGLFWLQGESDSTKAKDANAYLSKLKNFIESVRMELNEPNLPIVVSPVVWRGKKLHVVNNALREAGDGAVDKCVCIDPLDTERFGVQPEEAGPCAFHLTSGGVCDIGHRMGEALPWPPYN